MEMWRDSREWGVTGASERKHLSISLSSFWKSELPHKVFFIWELMTAGQAACFAASVSVIFVLTVSLFLAFGGHQHN